MNDGPGVPPERAPETTSVFRADFLSEAEPPAQDPGVSGVDALPEGAALLVVKRGPNAGSRFLLDRAVTSAGRHPDSDIFLDDVTVSRRHAEFRSDAGEFVVVDVGEPERHVCQPRTGGHGRARRRRRGANRQVPPGLHHRPAQLTAVSATRWGRPSGGGRGRSAPCSVVRQQDRQEEGPHERDACGGRPGRTPANQPILLLRETSGDRYLPIWIGSVEATAIALEQQGVKPARPLTHDLLKDVIAGLEGAWSRFGSRTCRRARSTPSSSSTVV